MSPSSLRLHAFVSPSSISAIQWKRKGCSSPNSLCPRLSSAPNKTLPQRRVSFFACRISPEEFDVVQGSEPALHYSCLEDSDIESVPLGDGSDGSGSRDDPPSSGPWRFDEDPPPDDDLPDDLREAVLHGSLTESALKRYREALMNPLLGALYSIPGFRTRALADSSFFFKLLAQELIGNGTALASEIAVRGRDIVHELEYVASDLIVGTVVEAGFVWLLAPTLALPSSGNAISQFLNNLPAHMFQLSSPLQDFTIGQRLASFLYAGVQYAAIGLVAGIVGTAITYGLIEGRKRLDRSYMPERPLPDVLPNSAAWAAFMALSSNPRFQVVEGLELVAQKLFARQGTNVVNGSIIVLRFANNYWGGVQFVQFFRYLGLHAVGEEVSKP